MGACAGKSNRPAVVVIKQKNRPAKQQNPSVPENHTGFDEYDEPQISQINHSDPQQKPQSPQNPIQDPHSQVENNPPEEQQVQHIPEKHIISPAQHEEKHSKDNGLDDVDEEDFANRLHKKESPNVNHQEQSGGFMLNLPGSQVGNQHVNHTNNEEKAIEEKKYESKNKDKRVKDIINNPDALEQSLSSPGTGLKNILGNKPQDDFDAVIEDKQHYPQHVEGQHRQSHINTGSQGYNVESSNKGEFSASPMSGVIQNRTSIIEKEKPISNESPVKVNKEIKEQEKEMRMSESPGKKESPGKLNMMRKSLEKMPWERTSGAHQDENEIEFFDDELETS